jgi:hypothetical protein
MAYSGLQIFQLNSGSPAAATDVVPFTAEGAGTAQKTAISEIVRVGLTSGAIVSGKIGNNAVNSGNIASGQIGANHLASGVIPAPFALSSGIITSGFVGNSAVLSGNIGSGQVGLVHLASGVITSGLAAVSLYSIGRNSTGDIMSGSAAVYISGSIGNRPSLGLGLATTDDYSAGIFGLVQSNIANNGDGVVITQGSLENANTSMFAEGDKLWLSPTVPGGLTVTRPTPPNHAVFIGNVIRSHPNLGVIEVTIQNGYELEELHNVASGNVTSGQILQYSSGLWWNKDIQINSGNISSGAVTQVAPVNLNDSQNYRLLMQKDDGTVAYNSGFMYNPADGTLFLGSGGIIISDVPSNNTIIAARSISNPTVPSGQVCVIVGDSILESNNKATGVVALGYLIGNNDGDQAAGSVALGWQTFSTFLGANNVGVGYRAANIVASGTSNTVAVGAFALGFAANASINTTAVGYGAAQNLRAGAGNSTYLGASSSTGVASGQFPNYEMAFDGTGSGSNKINMGSTSHTRFWTNGVIESPSGFEVVLSGQATAIAGINSGGFIFGPLSSGQVVSGNIASGQVAPQHLASGKLLFELLGSGATSFVATSDNGRVSGSITSVIIGDDAVSSGIGFINRSVIIGFDTGKNLRSGTTQTTLVGRNAGTVVAAGAILNSVTAVGAEAGSLFGSGSQFATMVGTTAGQYCNGTNNTGVGANALRGATAYTGNNNTAIGFQSLGNIGAGTDNVAAGVNALTANTTGSRNIGIGRDALSFSSTTTDNTAVGYRALAYEAINSGTMTARSNCGGFGNGAAINADNQIQIGNQLTTTYVFGTVQNRSDLRDKTDVRPISYGMDFIEKIKPKEFRWNYREAYWDYFTDENGNETRTFNQAEYDAAARKRSRFHAGVIAQELKETLDEMGFDFTGFQDHTKVGGGPVLSVGYEAFIPYLIKAIQELNARVKVLEAR